MKDEMRTNEENIRKTVKVLMQLDKQSLLLVDNGARLLLARQNLDKANHSRANR